MINYPLYCPKRKKEGEFNPGGKIAFHIELIADVFKGFRITYH